MEFSFPGLTRRESDVAALMIRSMLNKQIAAQLGISEQRVKNLRSSVYRKTKTKSSVELFSYCIRTMDQQPKTGGPIPEPRATKGDERYEHLITLLNQEELIRLKARAEHKADWLLVRTIETEIIKHRRK
jgi:DNA-binding CsgD family transcriptional regulator